VRDKQLPFDAPCGNSRSEEKRNFKEVRLRHLLADENGTAGIDSFISGKIEFEKFVVKIARYQRAAFRQREPWTT
jgi:hypothetical protein